MHAAPQKNALAPLWVEVALAVAGIVCGGVIAVVWLLLKPAVVVEHMPPPAQQGFGQKYYVKGSRDKARGASWVQKRQALLVAAPGTITLNEDELNAWFASSARTRQIRRKGAPAGADDDAPLTIGLVDFHIERGTLQVAAPVTVRIFSLRTDIIVQARGTFARQTGVNEAADEANLVMFSPEKIYAGSLPLHRIPGARAFLLRQIFANETLPGAGVAAWRKIESVTISGKDLRITLSSGL